MSHAENHLKRTRLRVIPAGPGHWLFYWSEVGRQASWLRGILTELEIFKHTH